MRTRVIRRGQASRYVSMSASRLANGQFRGYWTCSIRSVSTMNPKFSLEASVSKYGTAYEMTELGMEMPRAVRAPAAWNGSAAE